MNKEFTNSNEIKLSEKWKLTPDSDNGIILIFSEQRKRKNKKTELEENFIFEDKYYFPRICQALRYFVSKELNNNNNSIQDVIIKSEKLYDLIDEIDINFKQF